MSLKNFQLYGFCSQKTWFEFSCFPLRLQAEWDCAFPRPGNTWQVQGTLKLDGVAHFGGSKFNLSNIGPEAAEEKSFEILNIFPIQTYGAHTNA